MNINLSDILHGLTADRLTDWWSDYGPAATVAALAIAFGVLVIWFVLARRRGRAEPWIANLANVLVLTLTAEGTFMFALERLQLSWQLAACVFAVGEMVLVSQAMAAKRHLALARAALAEELFPGAATEAVKRHRRMAARHKTAVWVIATVVGLIVAGNSHTIVEAPFRLALPLAAAYMWWTSIEPDGERVAGTLRWTPRHLLIRLGAIAPEDHDVEQVHREHTVRAMVRLTVALEQRPASWLAVWRQRRLIRLGQVADADLLDEAAERVANALGIRARLTPTPEHPDTSAGTATLALDSLANLRIDGAQPPAPTSVATAATQTAPDVATRVATPGRDRRSSRRPPRQPRHSDTATRVAHLRKQYPAMSPATIADELGLSVRTVQRHLYGRQGRPNDNGTASNTTQNADQNESAGRDTEPGDDQQAA